MAQNQDVIAKSDASKAFRESVSQAVSHLTDVQRKLERAGNVVNDIVWTAGKGVSDMQRMMMDVCEDGCVGEIGASAASQMRERGI